MGTAIKHLVPDLVKFLTSGHSDA